MGDWPLFWIGVAFFIILLVAFVGVVRKPMFKSDKVLSVLGMSSITAIYGALLISSMP